MSPRDYRSPLRKNRAADTRRRIRKAARALFGKKGFVDTTVSDIAQKAGVSPATVYGKFESKAGIVSAMLDELEEAADVQQGLWEALADSTARQQLRGWMDIHCALFEQGADILRAATEAMHTPEVAAMMERGDRHRRDAIDRLAARWHTSGKLRPGLGPEEAGDRMWLLTTTDSYLTATDRLGWTPEEYRAWIVQVLDREVLAG